MKKTVKLNQAKLLGLRLADSGSKTGAKGPGGAAGAKPKAAIK